ncbi:hypothetical protein VTL71DRAFT_4947 [Oculimacula yallundae]|uniref:Uncharacterized protein n=1 Tax=Oculimacula yallundae TaxID=86028 RepID=A0ABR4C3C7_9HELO
MSDSWKKVKIKREEDDDDDDDDDRLSINRNLDELDLSPTKVGGKVEGRGMSPEPRFTNSMIDTNFDIEVPAKFGSGNQGKSTFKVESEGDMAAHHNGEMTAPNAKREAQNALYEDTLQIEKKKKKKNKSGVPLDGTGPIVPKDQAECVNCKGIKAPDGRLYDHKGHWFKDCTRNVTLRGTIFGCPWCNTTDHAYSSPHCTAPKSLKSAFRFLWYDRDGKPLIEGDWDLMDMFGNLIWRPQHTSRRPQTAQFALDRRHQEQPITQRDRDPYWDSLDGSRYATVSWDEISGRAGYRIPNIPREADPATIVPSDDPEKANTNQGQSKTQDSNSTNTGATGNQQTPKNANNGGNGAKQEPNKEPKKESKGSKRHRDETPHEDQYAKRHQSQSQAPPKRETEAERDLKRLEQQRLQLEEEDRIAREDDMNQAAIAHLESSLQALKRKTELDKIKREADKARAALGSNDSPQQPLDFSRQPGNDTKHFNANDRGRSPPSRFDHYNEDRGNRLGEETFVNGPANRSQGEQHGSRSQWSNTHKNGGRGQSTWQDHRGNGGGRGWGRGQGGGGRGGRGRCLLQHPCWRVNHQMVLPSIHPTDALLVNVHKRHFQYPTNLGNYSLEEICR